MPRLAPLQLSISAGEATLTLPLAPGALFEERTSPKQWRLFLPGLAPPPGLPAGTHPILPGLEAKAEAGGTTLSIPWKYWCPTEYTWLENPSRLAIRFTTIYREVEEETLAPGVRHAHIRLADANGPLNMHVLYANPHLPGVRVEPAMAGDGTIFARSTVSALTRKFGALAGVNGAYFSTKTGEPLGVLMINGTLLSGPMYNRSALAIGEKGALAIGATQLSYRLEVPTGETYDFDGLNQPRGLNRMVLYTSHYGVSTFTPSGGKEYALLTDGTIFAVQESNTPIPPGGMVISAHGQAAQWLDRYVRVGSRLTVRTPLTEFWPGVRHILGGGPALVRDGAIAVTAVQEQFKPDITQGLAPRTAVGLGPDGEMMLVTVDGRLPNISRGASLNGLAAIMQGLGATDALNLDGGGSTAMAIGPNLVNKPSDGVERAVNNALLIFGPQGQASR